MFDLEQDNDGDYSVLTRVLEEYLGNEVSMFDIFMFDGHEYQVIGHAGDYTLYSEVEG